MDILDQICTFAKVTLFLTYHTRSVTSVGRQPQLVDFDGTLALGEQPALVIPAQK